jgi:hypothetical protein
MMYNTLLTEDACGQSENSLTSVVGDENYKRKGLVFEHQQRHNRKTH